MRTNLFDFELPEDLIALAPAMPRDAARLLVVPSGGALRDRNVCDLPELLRPGDALVLNDTRVIPAALSGLRLRGEASVRVAVLLHKRLDASRWLAFARPAKRLLPGDRLHFGHDSTSCFLGALDGMVAAKGRDGEIEIAFDFAGPDLDAAIAAVGRMPLPPYIAGRRAVGPADASSYQTIYAAHDGAVAAPTAGLHFTDDLFRKLEGSGITRHFVTLHVGAGTFLPVKADDTADHKMHAERGVLSAETARALNETRARGGRVVAGGTTALRLLESATGADGTIQPWSGDTSIFITPGYRFRAVDILLTNFHLPRSTLFMLVAAFSGLNRMQAAYAHAIARAYRFYSYGDASLLFREGRD